jgi:hypothetical protein
MPLDSMDISKCINSILSQHIKAQRTFRQKGGPEKLRGKNMFIDILK